MIDLIPYEWGKIWRKRSFQVLTGALLMLNLFLLGYVNRTGEDEPPLWAYKAVGEMTSKMTEAEKLIYITQCKETIDGLALVGEVISQQARGDEQGQMMAEQLKEQNADIYEAYEELYHEGDYALITGDIYMDKKLMAVLYDEVSATADYEDYLTSVREERDTLSAISIFSDNEDSFSSRNRDKSAADYAGLSGENIHWYPSRGFMMAADSRVTDILLMLSVFLFTGSLITGEKSRGLFYLTRPTKRGIAHCMAAKLSALWLHCMTISLIFVGANYVFAGLTAGLGDLTAALQSMAPCIESNLRMSVLGYIIVSMLSKGMVLYGLGTGLTLIAVCSSKSFLPQLAGVGWLALSGLAYGLIPANSLLNPVKYMSFFGRMDTQLLYGSYDNLNIVSRPVSRLWLALGVTGAVCITGTLLAMLLFARGKSLDIRRQLRGIGFPFRPHGCLLRHEAYKLLIMEKGLGILLVFMLLLGYVDLGRAYSPSVSEAYYQDMMLKLEGEMTAEKEEMILAEKTRYDELFARIEQIEAMAANGEMDMDAAQDKINQYYGEAAFYPSFERILEQYERIQERGGVFVYDTGYRYLFGDMDQSLLLDLLLLCVWIVFCFGNVMAMEESRHAWHLLAATKKGKRAVIRNKVVVCSLCTVGMSLLPWLFRAEAILQVYPMGQWLSSVKNIPVYAVSAMDLPLAGHLILCCFKQMLLLLGVTGLILYISWRRKSYSQTLFLGLALLAVPFMVLFLL